MYTTLTNLKKYLPGNVIEQLTDDAGVGEIQGEIVDEAIANAQVTIDAYCRGRYPSEMDDDDVPDLIVDIATKLTAYNLYSRRLITTLPDTITNDYKYCISMLKQIQSGKINPWPAADEPIVFVSNCDSTSRIFNSTVWDTYPTTI